MVISWLQVALATARIFIQAIDNLRIQVILNNFKKNLHIPTGRYIFVATNMDTRTQILQHIFEAIKLHGYQGLRTDKVISELGVTKGAFYHYFPDKQSVGYAVTDEIIAPMYISNWSNLLTGNGSVLEHILAAIQR